MIAKPDHEPGSPLALALLDDLAMSVIHELQEERWHARSDNDGARQLAADLAAIRQGFGARTGRKRP